MVDGPYKNKPNKLVSRTQAEFSGLSELKTSIDQSFGWNFEVKCRLPNQLKLDFVFNLLRYCFPLIRKFSSIVNKFCFGIEDVLKRKFKFKFCFSIVVVLFLIFKNRKVS